MKKRKLFIISILIFLIFDCVAQVKPSLPIETDYLRGINSFKLFELYKNFEENEYIENVEKKHERFIASLTKLTIDSNLLGEWCLKDSESNEMIDKLSFYTGESFNIIKYKSCLEYNYKSNTSYIYTDGKDFYFYPSVHFSFIKKIVVIEDKLYFYILNEDEWMLDPIHENGKYYYSQN